MTIFFLIKKFNYYLCYKLIHNYLVCFIKKFIYNTKPAFNNYFKALLKVNNKNTFNKDSNIKLDILIIIKFINLFNKTFISYI